MSAALGVWAAAMVVTGTTTCPSPVDVSRALEALLPSSPSGRQPGAGDARAELLDAETSLRLRLLGADGAVLSEKPLPIEGSCAVMADTAAVVLAAWGARLNADVPLGFEAPRVESVASPPADPQPPATLPRTSHRWAAGLGVGVLASFEDPTVAPAVTVELRLRRVESGWGGRLGLVATGDHQQTLGPGRAVWRRLGASLGVLRHQAWGRVSVDGGLDLLAALLFVEGDGFSTVRNLRTWDVGAGPSARLALGLGRLEPWVAVGATAWLRPQFVEVTGVAEQQQLTRLELLAGAGFTVLLSD